MSLKTHPSWGAPLHAIRSAIAWSSSPQPIREPAFRVVDALQFYPAGVQMDALASLFVAMAEVIGLDAHEMVARAKRQLPDLEGPFTEQLQAARDYAKGELR